MPRTKTVHDVSTGETVTLPYTPEEEAAADAMLAAYLAAEAAYVPPTVSPYQARIALLNAGLLASVEAMMADPATPQSAKIAWEYATQWNRNSDFIASLGPALGLTSSQIDDLFRAAIQIV